VSSTAPRTASPSIRSSRAHSDQPEAGEAGVYEEDTVMDGLQLKLIADINTKTLTLSDKYIGCWGTAKWQ